MSRITTAFHDTLFAYILRSAFGARVFPYPDEKVLPTIWQDKQSSQVSPRDSIQPKPDPDATSVLSEATAIATPGRADPEKGQDHLLVDWDGPSDPDVSCRWGRLYPSRLQVTLESIELVQYKKGMGHVSDVSSNNCYLPWLCHLYRWDPLYHFRVPCEHCCCDSWAYCLCCWLRSWLVSTYLNFVF
jgi:hypothetical protein